MCVYFIYYNIYNVYTYIFFPLDSPILNLLIFWNKKHNSGNQAANSKHSSMYSLVIKRNTLISFSYSAASCIFSSATGLVDTSPASEFQDLRKNFR